MTAVLFFCYSETLFFALLLSVSRRAIAGANIDVSTANLTNKSVGRVSATEDDISGRARKQRGKASSISPPEAGTATKREIERGRRERRDERGKGSERIGEKLEISFAKRVRHSRPLGLGLIYIQQWLAAEKSRYHDRRLRPYSTVDRRSSGF